MTDDERVTVIAPSLPPPPHLPLPLLPATSSFSSPLTSTPLSTISSSSTPTPPITLPVDTANLIVSALNPGDLELDSEFTLVTSKVKIVSSKTVTKSVTNSKKQKNNGSKNGSGKESGSVIGKESKDKIIEKISFTRNSDPGPAPVPAASTVVKAITFQQSAYVHSPVTSVTPDNYMRELFNSFQNKMAANRSKSSDSNYNGYNNHDHNDSNITNSSNSSSRNRTDSINSVRANSSDPVQFAAEVAASGARTTVIGKTLSLSV